MNIAPHSLPVKNSGEARLPEMLAAKNKIYIINLKMPTDEIPALDKERGIFPAWHMNARNWVSILLEDIFPDYIIMDMVAKSYTLTNNKKARHS